MRSRRSSNSTRRSRRWSTPATAPPAGHASSVRAPELRRRRSCSSKWTEISPIIVPIRPCPKISKQLQRRSARSKADIGIAFDGDADRIGAMDENGDVIYGDMLLLISGREILTRKPGATFIGEVKCSQMHV